jgi:hypothetical protein
MPNRDHWSASMLLHWVLTRDSDAVLSTVTHYGGWLVKGDTVARIQPQTWDDVIRAYSIDESLPKEEKAAEAVVRAKLFVIPAQQQIYSCLRRVAIDSWARPNGSGDIVKITPIQWAGLRFRGFKGHDIAVPVDSEQNPLPLPQPLGDYLSGSVPPTSMPTVWPDPLFLAEQAMKLWPPRDGVEVLRSDIEALSPCLQQPSRKTATVLSPGPKGGETKPAAIAWEIAEQILADDGRRPPRGHGRPTALAIAVQPLLRTRGHNRRMNTITKYIRSSFKEWEAKNPKK